MKVSVHDIYNEKLMFVLVFPVRNMFYCSYIFFKPNIGREFSILLLVNEYCNVASLPMIRSRGGVVGEGGRDPLLKMNFHNNITERYALKCTPLMLMTRKSCISLHSKIQLGLY